MPLLFVEELKSTFADEPDIFPLVLVGGPAAIIATGATAGGGKFPYRQARRHRR